MKAKNLFLYIIVMFFISKISFAQITFQKTYDGLGGISSGQSVQQTTDSGYVIVGSTSNGSAMSDIFAVKTDVIGNIVWAKTYGTTLGDIGYSIEQTKDGGFIIAGYTEGQGLLKYIYLIKTDINGDSLWTKTYYGNGESVAYSVHQTFDNGYVFVGQGGGWGSGSSYGICMIKTNDTGDTLWTRTFGGVQDYARSVVQTNDSGYAITGTLSGNVFLIKTNDNGDTLWTKNYGGGHGNSVRQTFDGGYMIAGTTLTPTNWLDCFLYKTNSYGDILWAKTYGGTGTEESIDVFQTVDSGYIISGRSTSFGYKTYLIKTNVNGDTLWAKVFGNNWGYGNSVKQTYDGGYIVGGNTEPGLYFFYLIKTDSNGNSGCAESPTATVVGTPIVQVLYTPTPVSSCAVVISIPPNTSVQNLGTMTTICTSVGIQSENQNPKSKISISPNPFHTAANISLNENFSFSDLSFKIFNVEGKTIRQFAITSHESIIQREGLAAGVYFYQLTDGGNVKSIGKLLIQ